MDYKNLILSSIALDELVKAITDAVKSTPTIEGHLQPELINRFELCKRLGITEAHAIRLGKKGDIPEIRIGSSVRYNWPKVIEALENKGGAA
ncbi:helix-turn-helix domain-containing protein [Flavihumibacter sediminis]|nr:helix-turn-helix domain-containing protein [Flavihumibacter sediminis]